MEDTTNRQVRAVRTFKAQVELMWKVWADPAHIVTWWGPKGFSNTIHEMDFREGGEWKLTMHGPDGTNFANRSIFKEIVPFKKIVFEHFNPHFLTTVIFDGQAEETVVDWTLLFDTAEMREIVVKAHKADKGQEENLDKLEGYLHGLTIGA